MLNYRKSSKLVINIFLFFLIELLFKSAKIEHPENIEILENSAECVQRKLQRFYDDEYWQLWEKFTFAVNMCSPKLENVKLSDYANTDELKYHYLPLVDVSTINCSIISLGIGKDVKAEKKMKYNMPECLFYGADPIEDDNRQLFEQIGDFYNMAVGDRNGSFRSYVLEDIYRYQEVETVDLITFINQKVRQKTIDQMMIDIEHAEYKILKFFSKNGELENHGIHVCQINIEIHKPEKFEDRITFSKFLETNFIAKQWIFINAEIHPILKHIRLFMINSNNPECVRRYLKNL